MADFKKTSRFLLIGQGIDGDIAPLVSGLARDIHAKGWGCMVRYVGRPAPAKYVAMDRQKGIDSDSIITGEALSLFEVLGLLRSMLSIFNLVREKRPVAVIFAGFMPALIYPPVLRLISKAHFIYWDHAPQSSFLKTKKLLFPFALKNIDHVVSVSQSSASALNETFSVPKDIITIIPNGSAMLDRFWRILGG